MEYRQEEVQVRTVKVNGRHRTDLGDLGELAASIDDVGLIHPIIITEDHELIAGQRRLEAVRKLGRPTILARIVTDLSSAVERLKVERDENTARKPMTSEELVSLGLALEELERPRALGRKTAGVVASQPSDQLTGRLTRDKGETRGVVADALGMSAATYDRAKFVVNAANDPGATPENRELAREALAEMNATGKIHGAYTKIRRLTPRAKASIDKAADQRRTLDRAVSTLSGIAHALDQIEALHPAVTNDEAAQWVDGLSESRAVITVLIRRLKERTNVDA